MPQIDGPVKRIVQEQCALLLRHPMVVSPTDINDDVAVALLIDRMLVKYPDAHKAVRQHAVREWYAQQLAYAIRHTREPEVENIRSLQESVQRARKDNRFESLRKADGSYDRRPYLLFTPKEGMVLAEQYRRSGNADLRRAAQFEADAKNAIQMGLPEDQPYSILIDKGVLVFEADGDMDYQEVAG